MNLSHQNSQHIRIQHSSSSYKLLAAICVFTRGHPVSLTASLHGKVSITRLCIPDAPSCPASPCRAQPAVAIISNPGMTLQTLWLTMKNPRRYTQLNEPNAQFHTYHPDLIVWAPNPSPVQMKAMCRHRALFHHTSRKQTSQYSQQTCPTSVGGWVG